MKTGGHFEIQDGGRQGAFFGVALTLKTFVYY